MMKIEDVDEDTIAESFPVPSVIEEINNTEKDLKEFEGKIIDELVFEDDSSNSEKLNNEEFPKVVPDFSNMINFLKPASKAVEKVIKEITLENPEVLTELLSLDFTDLLKVFQRIFVQSNSIEEAYRTLFKGIGEKGADNFVKTVFASETSKDSEKDNKVEEMVTKFVSTMSGDGKNIAEILGDKKINELVAEYLKNNEKTDEVFESVDNILKVNTHLYIVQIKRECGKNILYFVVQILYLLQI